MSTKKANGNGHDAESESTAALLRQVVEGLGALRRDLVEHIGHTNALLERTNERLDRTNERLDRTNEELHAFKEQAMDELAGLRADLRSHRAETAAHVTALSHDVADAGGGAIAANETLSNHEARIAKLEELLLKKTGS